MISKELKNLLEAYTSIYEKKGEEDHEVSMIRAQLHSIMKSCESLMSHMQGDEKDVEAWVQAKITRAEEDLHAAANYIDSGESEVSEANHNFVYGSPKPATPKDKRMLVTKADQKANTPAYQRLKAGNPKYKAASGHGIDEARIDSPTKDDLDAIKGMPLSHSARMKKNQQAIEDMENMKGHSDMLKAARKHIEGR